MVIKWGKNKGKSFDEVERSYLFWLIENSKYLKQDERREIVRILNSKWQEDEPIPTMEEIIAKIANN